MKQLGLKAAWEKQKEQERLHTQYNVENENTIVVERKNPVTNTLRLLLRAAGQTVHIIFNVLLIALAFIGLTTLIYPSTRSAFVANMEEALQVLQSFLG